MNVRIIDDFILFLKKSFPSILIVAFFILLAFCQKIGDNSFSIDTEHYLFSYSNTFDWWISLNRWGLVFVNKLFGFTPLIISLSNFLTIIMMLVYSIVFSYLFYLHIDDRYKELYIKFQFILPVIFLTSPIFAEQYNFINQNFGVSFGFFLEGISLILLYYSDILKGKLHKLLFVFCSILLSVLSFGIYQSFIPFYLLIVVCCYFLKVFFNNINDYKFIIKRIVVFCIICILYLIICKFFGKQNSYLSISWKTDSFFNCIRNIYYVVIDMIKCKTIFYNVSYYIALLCLSILILYKIIIKKINLSFILSSFLLVLSPFYIMIITGADQLKRTQFNYSFFIGFCLLCMIFIIKEFKRNSKLFYFVLVFFSLGVGYRQSYITANLFYSDNVRFNYDLQLANNIQVMIENNKNYYKNEKYKIIFLGHYYNKPLNSYLTGEVIGSSFFEFDYQAIYGVNQRANIFLKTLGYDYDFADEDDFQWAKKYVMDKKISSYPKKDSIFIVGNKIIVRLSDDI